MKNQTIDVLIPVYNCEKYIKKCLNSILNQTYKNLRIIAVDDGSKDNSLNILKDFSKKYKNIEVYQKENEGSISKTRNFLISKIKSNYFAFIDSDDYCEPTYFEELMNLMTTYKTDITICKMKRHSEKKNLDFSKINKKCNNVYIMNNEECIAEMLSGNLYTGTCPAKLYKTELIKDNKFNPNIHYGEDLDFNFKIMQNANKIAFSKKRLYHYIVHKNSIVTSKFNTKKLTCIDCYDIIINKIQGNQTLLIPAKSMQGLIAIELLYYTWRDRFKDKAEKKKLKNIIKYSVPYIRKNKKLSKINRCAALVWWLTKFM